MEEKTTICNRAEQICLKFQSIVSLYKDLQQSNSEEDDLLLLGTLRDVKSFLSDREREKRAIEDEDENLGNIVDGLRSHAGIVALKRLVRDVKDIKENLKYLREKIDQIEGRKLPRRPYIVDEESKTCDGGPLDSRFWERLTKRRQELLGDVEVAFEKRKKSLRFPPNVSITKTTECNQATTVTSPKPASSSAAIDKRLSNRIAKLKDFLAEKQSRLNAARKSVVGTILDAEEAECEVHNTESAIYRSQIARRTTQESVNDRDFSSVKENFGDLNICSDCQTDQKAKDKFWGLASESADEEEYVRKILSLRRLSDDVTELNEDEANVLFKKLNIDKRRQGKKNTSRKKSKVIFEVPSTVKIHDPDSSKVYVIKRRPSGRAGRGTWATPPHSPNWIVFGTQGSHQRPRTVSFAKSTKELNKRNRRNSHTRRKLERISEARRSAET